MSDPKVIVALDFASAQEALPEFPITPTRLIVLARFLKQYEEFFVAGGTHYRRFGEPTPP